MKNFFDDQINELLKELETDVIFIVNQLSCIIAEDRDLFLERLSLLSGISRERLIEIMSYRIPFQGLDSNLLEQVGPVEFIGSDDYIGFDEIKGKSPINLTVQEIHSLCNAISFSLSLISEEKSNLVMGDFVDGCDSIIERWVETVNNYLDRSNNIFDKLVAASEAATSGEFFSTYHIFVDSTALCDENMADVLNIVIPEIKNVAKPLKVTVPKAVVDCLQDMAKDEKQKLLFGADEGLRNLRTIQKEGLLSVRGDGADTTIMSTFLSAFSRFKPVYKMALLTQDEALANAVQMLNTSGVEGTEIIICKLCDNNDISLWFDNELEENDTDDLDESGEVFSDNIAEEDTLVHELHEDSQTEDVGIDTELLNKAILVAGIAPAEEEPTENDAVPEDVTTESIAEDEMPTETEMVYSYSDDDYGIDSSDEQLDQATINEVETDIEKMSMLEEQLANMLGKSVITTNEDADDDEELSDDDDFEEDADELDPSTATDGLDLDFSENDTLIADAFESDSWSVLD